MAVTTLTLGSGDVVPGLAGVIRDARQRIGWSQAELATRAGTSQAMVSRLESGGRGTADVAVAERVLTAVGLHGRLVIDDWVLADRDRQRDGVHACVNGYVARRMARDAWIVPTEVLIDGPRGPRGWIDLLGYREADRSLLVEETKTDIPDMGGLQRSVAFYQQAAWTAARRFGWRPERVVVLVVLLDSVAVARRLADNRDLVTRAFPAPIPDVAAWLASPAHPAPTGWAMGTCDPASRSATWLRPTMLGARRRPPAYLDYADAARRLLRS